MENQVARYLGGRLGERMADDARWAGCDARGQAVLWCSRWSSDRLSLHTRQISVSAQGAARRDRQPATLTAATALFLGVVGTGRQTGSLYWAPVATVGWIGSHHTHTEHLNRSVFMGATGAQVGFRDVFLSEQLTATSTETNALSSGSEFMTSLGLRLGPVVRVARHVSNGGLVGIGLNHGETMSLVGVTFCSAA